MKECRQFEMGLSSRFVFERPNENYRRHLSDSLERGLPIDSSVGRMQIDAMGQDVARTILVSLTGLNVARMTEDTETRAAGIRALRECIQKGNLTYEQCIGLLHKIGVKVSIADLQTERRSEDQLLEPGLDALPALDRKAAARLVGGEATLGRVVKAFQILERHPEWKDAIEDAIRQNPITMPDGSVRYIPIGFVLANMLAESRGKNSPPKRGIHYVDSAGREIGATSVGPMQTMAGHNGAQKYFIEELTKGYTATYRGTKLTPEGYAKMKKNDRIEAYYAAIESDPALGIREGVRHIRDKILEYNMLNPRYPLDPENPNHAADIRLCYSGGTGGAIKIKRFVNEPTAENRAALPPYANYTRAKKKKGKIIRTAGDIAMQKYQGSRKTGRIAAGAMLLSTPQYVATLASLVPGAAPQKDMVAKRDVMAGNLILAEMRKDDPILTGKILRDKLRKEVESEVHASRGGYIGNVQRYLGENGERLARVIVFHNARLKGTKKLLRDEEGNPRIFYRSYEIKEANMSAAVKNFLDKAVYDNTTDSWVAKDPESESEKIWVHKGDNLQDQMAGMDKTRDEKEG